MPLNEDTGAAAQTSRARPDLRALLLVGLIASVALTIDAVAVLRGLATLLSSSCGGTWPG